IKSLPLPMSVIPLSSPASETFLIPNVRRYAAHVSSSFFLRMNRLKFNLHTTSCDFVKFNVENGISIVAVQPSMVIMDSDVHTPSQPQSKSTSSEALCSSTIKPSLC